MGSAIKRLATVAVVGSAFLGHGALAGERKQPNAVGPGQGLVIDVGSKHTVSYFLADDGKCNLTLMVGEKANEDGDHSTVGARVRMAIDAGRSARVETAEGKSLEFACAADARSLKASTLDVMAYTRQ